MKDTEATRLRKLANSTPDLSKRGKREKFSKEIGSPPEWQDSPRRITVNNSPTNAAKMRQLGTSVPNLNKRDKRKASKGTGNSPQKLDSTQRVTVSGSLPNISNQDRILPSELCLKRKETTIAPPIGKEI